MNTVPGVDMSTGSLGQGVSAAAGMALAAKMKNPDGTPLLSHDIQQRAAAYLEEYGA